MRMEPPPAFIRIHSITSHSFIKTREIVTKTVGTDGVVKVEQEALREDVYGPEILEP